MSFHGLIAHVLMVLNNTLLSEYTTVCPFTHEGHLGCFQVLAVMNEAGVAIHVLIFV